ncbi:MAG TPA: hypothetical protein VFT89_11235 [Rhizobiaceae bacterium]|nr:hypothetical protein [Rhizobiaceae bacterium]
MFRTTDMVLIAVMLSAAAFTYKIKGDAETKLAEIRKLETAIRLEEDTIDVLKADWSLLTQPARLQRLTEIYSSQLELVPVEAQQIVEIEDLPMAPPLQIEDRSSEPLGGMADSGQDPVVTGGVVR